MLGQFLRRLFAVLPKLLLVLVAAFLFLRFTPGGPFDITRPESSAIQSRLAVAYDRDAPLATQAQSYARGLAFADLGPSQSNGDKSVAEIISEGAATTAVLTLSSLILALVVGGGFGVAAALRAPSLLDRAVGWGALMFMCLAPVLLGALLQRAFALEWRLLPEGGLDRDTFSARALTLPVLSLAIPFAALVTAWTRTSMIETLSGGAARSARARGLPEARVIRRHVLPVVTLAIVQRSGTLLTGLCAGSLVVETLFQLPGIGRALVIAARQHDVPVASGIVLVYAAIVVALAWGADLAARALSPRMRAA